VSFKLNAGKKVARTLSRDAAEDGRERRHFRQSIGMSNSGKIKVCFTHSATERYFSRRHPDEEAE
jgi:hypothetical protein